MTKRASAALSFRAFLRGNKLYSIKCNAMTIVFTAVTIQNDAVVYGDLCRSFQNQTVFCLQIMLLVYYPFGFVYCLFKSFSMQK